MSEPSSTDPREFRYTVSGMDCRSCVTKIEEAARQVEGMEDPKVSMSSGILTVRTRDASRLKLLEQAVTGLGYRLSSLDKTPEGGTQMSGDDDDPPADMTQVTPAYRRALWIVVILNVLYGLVEIIAGVFGRSQALKADSLDFLGDGTITFLGLLAVGWRLVWRARAALIQGIFLGLLGLGVMATTLYRVLVQDRPEAGIMGLFGILALIVNVTAALVLIPHRTGDANVRAVWLFSRNDAIGNAAVILAAGLVVWTKTAWPDIVVAFLIAGLFLHSSWAIIRDARADLQEATKAEPPSYR